MAEKQQPEETTNTNKPITRRDAMKRIAKMGTAVMLMPLVAGMRMAKLAPSQW